MDVRIGKLRLYWVGWAGPFWAFATIKDQGSLLLDTGEAAGGFIGPIGWSVYF